MGVEMSSSAVTFALTYRATVGALVGVIVVACMITAVLEVTTPKRRVSATRLAWPRMLDRGTEALAPSAVGPRPADVAARDHGPAMPLIAVQLGPPRPTALAAATPIAEPDPIELAGVLFAAYVASGRPERSRVTGWVTALATPPSQPNVVPGEGMRGRPRRIVDLLRCGDEGRNWITLNPAVDIERGLTRRAPFDDVLLGLVAHWRTAVQHSELAEEDAALFAGALWSVLPAMVGNPLCETVLAMAEEVDRDHAAAGDDAEVSNFAATA